MEHILCLRYQECKGEWETALALDQRIKPYPPQMFLYPTPCSHICGRKAL